MTRLRVVHCIYDDVDNPWVGGGGARRVFDLYRELASAVDATIVTGRYPGSRNALEMFDGRVRVRRVGTGASHAASRVAYSAAASALLRRETYDVAVVDHSGYAPVVIPRRRPVGFVVHHLAGPTAAARWASGQRKSALRGTLITALERASLRRGRDFSATSHATAELLREFLPPSARIVAIASGAPDALFDLRRHEQPYILYLGRMDVFQKGLDVLLDAFAAVNREHPAIGLRLAGRGRDSAPLRARAAELGVADAVEFVGAVPDAERNALLAGAMVQVMPSRFEGFGIAAAEALAAGVPLVVSDTHALREIVAPRVAGGDAVGCVVPVGDAQALASAITTLVRRPDLRRRLSAEGRASAERFRWKTIAARHLAFLERIANHAHAQPPHAR